MQLLEAIEAGVNPLDDLFPIFVFISDGGHVASHALGDLHGGWRFRRPSLPDGCDSVRFGWVLAKDSTRASRDERARAGQFDHPEIGGGIPSAAVIRRLIASTAAVLAVIVPAASARATTPPIDDQVYEVIVRGCFESSYPIPFVLTSTDEADDLLELALAYCAVAADLLRDATLPAAPALNLCVAALNVELSLLNLDLSLSGSPSPLTIDRFTQAAEQLGPNVEALLAGGAGDCVIQRS